ncbi:hypothetical protein XP1511_17630 [Xanthomonas perforans]|nr:hypothetical protein XEUV206_00660 [Xanthomonas euvesicatoria]KLC30579.1 hypothetical protein XP112_21655 [Xanthomonas perforans]KLC40150.1 hypothetical protein XP95_00070 [Xanthomonas perforans]KLC42073.1 hypothetical protein XP1511_17630 [Xanthomonas perforans]
MPIWGHAFYREMVVVPCWIDVALIQGPDQLWKLFAVLVSFRAKNPEVVLALLPDVKMIWVVVRHLGSVIAEAMM